MLIDYSQFWFKIFFIGHVNPDKVNITAKVF